VLDTIEQCIKDSRVPGVLTEQKPVTTGFLGVEKRKFLVVRHTRYKEFHLFIGSRSFGEHLDCGWFLTVEPSFFKSQISKRVAGNPLALSQKLDFFSQQDVRALQFVVHNCFIAAINILLEELQADATPLTSDVKGYLNVW
jgi:hypothetical protein